MRIFIKFILIIFLVGAFPSYAQTSIPEDEVKAAFIFHFLNYTQWDDGRTDYNVCIPEDDSFRAVARSILQGKEVNGRKIAVMAQGPSCHVLVSGFSPQTDSTLTIGNLSRGALFEFRIINNKLKFAADLERIKNSKFKMSIQLLKMAILDKK